ncbi:uncharacterized protein LOC120675709 [Panicum virgatum]|uniref:uncharacterized protein LOC120675709 n=1 Tax=Panicum virgatum TaxID=38727 RepID=UPI0019D5F092|nr:uncharacterized protein LOC120675709 [Panicum virgatum]
MASALELTRYASAPRSSIFSAPFRDDELIPVTWWPIAFATFTPMWPTPLSPRMPPRRPGAVSPKCFSGLYTVTPAHSSSAACSGARPAGIGTTNLHANEGRIAQVKSSDSLGHWLTLANSTWMKEKSRQELLPSAYHI